MCDMPTEGIKIEKHFLKNLGLYFTDGFGSDGSVVKGLKGVYLVPGDLVCSSRLTTWGC